MGEFIWLDQSKARRSDESLAEWRDRTWGEVPLEQRSEWLLVMLQHRPYWLATFGLRAVSTAARNGDPVTPPVWVDVTGEFHRAGFSPEDYLELRSSVTDGELEAAAATSPSLVRVYREWPNRPDCRLFGDGWAEWLPLRRSGVSAREATEEILRRG